MNERLHSDHQSYSWLLSTRTSWLQHTIVTYLPFRLPPPTQFYQTPLLNPLFWLTSPLHLFPIPFLPSHGSVPCSLGPWLVPVPVVVLSPQAASECLQRLGKEKTACLTDQATFSTAWPYRTQRESE